MRIKILLLSIISVVVILMPKAYAQYGFLATKELGDSANSATVTLTEDTIQAGNNTELKVTLENNSDEAIQFTFRTDANLSFFPHNHCTIPQGGTTCFVDLSAGFKNVVGKHEIHTSSSDSNITINNPKLDISVTNRVISKMYLGSNDVNTSPILECHVSSVNGQLGQCKPLNLNSVKGITDNQTTLSGGNFLNVLGVTYVYFAGVNSGEGYNQILRCPMKKNDVDVANCKKLNMKNRMGNDLDENIRYVTFNTFTTHAGSTTYAYVSNDSQGIYRCIVNQQGALINCRMQAQGKFVNSANIAIKAIAGKTYIYVGSASDQINYITRCRLNSVDGSLAKNSCIKLYSSIVFVSPARIAIDDYSGKIYIANYDQLDSSNNKVISCKLTRVGKLANCKVLNLVNAETNKSYISYPGDILPVYVNSEDSELSPYLYVGDKSSAAGPPSNDHGNIVTCQLDTSSTSCVNSNSQSFLLLHNGFQGGVDGILAY